LQNSKKLLVIRKKYTGSFLNYILALLQHAQSYSYSIRLCRFMLVFETTDNLVRMPKTEKN